MTIKGKRHTHTHTHTHTHVTCNTYNTSITTCTADAPTLTLNSDTAFLTQLNATLVTESPLHLSIHPVHM